ncbi:MAG: small-conductance mechanosensitive ion channel, partial [Chloroflexota bacterium]|nr:small-conductance mechanosensitive ion channel [Chloroflexota bacterium]
MSDIGTTIGSSLSNVLFLLFAAIPRIIGFLIIILVGWIIAGILAKLVVTILRTIKFNEMAQRAHLTGMVQ